MVTLRDELARKNASTSQVGPQELEALKADIHTLSERLSEKNKVQERALATIKAEQDKKLQNVIEAQLQQTSDCGQLHKFLAE